MPIPKRMTVLQQKLSRSAALISRDVYNNEQKEINGYKPVEKLEDAQTGLRVVTYKRITTLLSLIAEQTMLKIS